MVDIHNALTKKGEIKNEIFVIDEKLLEKKDISLDILKAYADKIRAIDAKVVAITKETEELEKHYTEREKEYQEFVKKVQGHYM